ncbi:hypothetical protein BDB00DRAFT_825233 [Zychaea mexicana]|uniref:uncharacterized protein n=1 Tax=Zychaea mexicana TaxID=64656 RepID=UPI0022FDF450|nr:uncharacterized protein BDB00DRAFT_825233 [Zychaea mexicana]KAI9493054.1 hypothetical protein BDB00DRAFT_825233 [Zychaea mexicana]
MVKVALRIYVLKWCPWKIKIEIVYFCHSDKRKKTTANLQRIRIEQAKIGVAFLVETMKKPRIKRSRSLLFKKEV